jgi:hypothetical protein
MPGEVGEAAGAAGQASRWLLHSRRQRFHHIRFLPAR